MSSEQPTTEGRVSDERLAQLANHYDDESPLVGLSWVGDVCSALRELQRLRSPAGAGTNHQDPGTPGDERRLAVGAARVEGVGATASLPEPSGGESSYRRMFEAACSSLGEIAREAGVPEEHADDGPEAILDAIRALKQRTSPEPCGDCKDCDTLITERDNAEEQADKLAECIADLLGIDIGEHSSGNAPWQNAIDAAEYELDKRKRSAPEPGGQPPAFYRLQRKGDAYDACMYPASEFDLVIVPQPPTKEVKP